MRIDEVPALRAIEIEEEFDTAPDFRNRPAINGSTVVKAVPRRGDGAPGDSRIALVGNLRRYSWQCRLLVGMHHGRRFVNSPGHESPYETGTVVGKNAGVGGINAI